MVVEGIGDRLRAHTAFLNSHGTIVAVNTAWRDFGLANGLSSDTFEVGSNYLDVCQRAKGKCSEEARQVEAGVREILQRDQYYFSLKYPCHSAAERRWFRMVAVPRSAGSAVMHFNITKDRLRQQRQRRWQAALSRAMRIAAVGAWYYDILADRLEWPTSR